MKSAPFFPFLLFSIFLTRASLFAQCGQAACAPGVVIPALCAEDACLLCSATELDGYTGSTQTFNPNSCDIPGPFCGSVENNQWFAFIAWDPDIVINFEVSDCAGAANGSGIQAEIYRSTDCDEFISVSDCFSPGMPANGSVVASNLVPGQAYYLMVDGWAGDICNFTITVPSASPAPDSLPIPVISGPLSVPTSLSGYSAIYSAAVAGAVSYSWSISPASAGSLGSSGPSVAVVWSNQVADTVQAQLCVTASSPCATEVSSCVEVTVTGSPIGSFCDVAQFLCDGIDGLSTSLPPVNMQQPFSACPSSVLNNPLWYAFIAGTETISISVTPSNCEGTNGQFGAQGAIYNSCNGTAVATYCQCTEGPFVLASSGFQPGQTYYLVVDGCAGDVCDIDIQVENGATDGVPANHVEGPATVCPSATAFYQIDPHATGILTYQWSIDPMLGTILSYGPDSSSIQVEWADSIGAADVCLQTTNICQDTVVSCLSVSVAYSDLILDGDTTVCIGETTYYTLVQNYCDYVFDYWHLLVGGGTILTDSSSQQVAVQWDAPGLFDICAHFTDTNSSNSLSRCLWVMVDDGLSNPACLPCDSLQAEAGELAVNCLNVSLPSMVKGTSAIQGSFLSYQWTANGTLVSNSDSVDVLFPGLYVFSVTNTLNGCTDSDTLHIVADLEGPVAYAGPDLLSPCPEGGPVVLDGSNSSAGPEFLYEWVDGNFNIISQENTVTVNGPGLFTLSVMDTSNGCISMDEVIVENPPPLSLLPLSTPDSCNLGTGTAQVIVPPGTPSLSYEWITGDTTSMITGLFAGDYSVTVYFGMGCSTYIIVSVDSVICNGLFDNIPALDKLMLLPNPNDGRFTVYFELGQTVELEFSVVDILGRQVKRLSPATLYLPGGHSLPADLGGLSPGSYFLNIQSPAGGVIRRFVKME